MINQKYQDVLSVGSGSSGLLLQENLDDRSEFTQIHYQLKQNAKIRFNGMFGIIIAEEEAYIYGQLVQIYQIPKLLFNVKVKTCSVGWNHAIILSQDEVLYGIGSNKFHEMGFDQKIVYEEPTKLTFQYKGIKSIACGFRQSFFLYANYYYACGQNKNNEIGGELFEPQFQLKHFPKIAKIKCGLSFTLALTSDNQLFGWGNNKFGQLTQNGPLITLLAENVIKFDCGWNHHVILKSDNTAHIVGRGDMGQQGDGMKKNHNQYQQIYIEKIQNVKCGSESTFLICQDSIYVTGWNEHGNLGVGHNKNIYEFTPIQYGRKIKTKAAVAYKFI